MTAADRPTVTPRVGDTITTAEQLDALPVGSVIVDPYDEKGDAPVVLCRASDGPWAALTTGLLIGKGWWTSTEIASAAKSVRVVYIPGEQSPPPVTDDARAEAERRYPSDVAHRGLTHPTGAVREHRQAAFVAGAERAAARADTTTEDMQTLDARWFGRWETEQPLADKYAGYYQGRVSAVAQCREELRRLLATARTRPTRDELILALAQADGQPWPDGMERHAANHMYGKQADAVLALLGSDEA